MSGRPDIVVFDYGSGNVHSAVKALVRAGADVELTGDRDRALAADGLVVPGVGAFDSVVEALTQQGGDSIIDSRLAGGRPVLGICVGMQIMFERGDERGSVTDGLGHWPGDVAQLDADVLPHMGWNLVTPDPGSKLFAGIEHERFYFVHSNAASAFSLEATGPFRQPVLTWSNHGGPFLAAVENGPLTATQFHPEKSGDAGIALLTNWLRSVTNN